MRQIKSIFLATTLGCALLSAGFCAFNMSSDSDFTISVHYNNWALTHSFVLLPGQQFCSMKGLNEGDVAHYHIFTTVDYGEWITEYPKELDAPTNIEMFFVGDGENWKLLTQQAN